MRPILIAAAALAGALALPSAAMARPGFVTASLSLRAGPGIDFPAVDRIPAGARVNIHGCIVGYRWCDVSFAGNRGWVDGDELQFLYRGRRVLIVDYGPEIDFPIVSFDIGTYWQHHYRGRNFYGRLGYWENRYQAHRGGRDITVGRGGHERLGNDHRRDRAGTVGRGHDATVGARAHGTLERERGAAGHVGAPGEHGGAHGMRSRGPQTTGATPHAAATTGAGIAGGHGGGIGGRAGGGANIGGSHRAGAPGGGGHGDRGDGGPARER